MSEEKDIRNLRAEVSGLLQRVADLEFLLRRMEPRVQLGEAAWGMVAVVEHDKMAREAQQKGV